MPVEVSRIKGRLKELFPKANLSTKRLDELAARLAKKPADEADDTAIDQVINDANDFMPFADIAKEDDRIRTLEAKSKEQDPPKPNDPPADPPAPKKEDDEPEWAKRLFAKVEAIEKGKITESKEEAAKKLFESNETLKNLKETVKEKWFNRIDVNSETSVEDQITDLEAEYTDLVQLSADSITYAGAPPNGKTNIKPTDEELKDIADAI